MPIQRRLPKRGFRSQMAGQTAELRLSDLEKMKEIEIDLALLKSSGVVPLLTQQVKVIKSGKLTRKVQLKGLGVTRGAREVVTALGGDIQE